MQQRAIALKTISSRRRLRSSYFCAALIGVATPVAADDSPSSPARAAATRPRQALPVRVSGEMSLYSDTEAVTVFTPSLSATLGNSETEWQARAESLVDVVSAASVDIVSSASPHWTEVRKATTVDVTHHWDNVGASASVAGSIEPDYQSLAAGGEVVLELQKKTINPVFGYSFGHDIAGRTGTPFLAYSQPLDRHSLSAGVELVLNRSTTFSVALDAVLERGDQKKPYRMLPLFSPGAASRVPAGASLALVNELRLPARMTERTPLERNRFALYGRLSTRFSGATLTLDERLYSDDWGLLASTNDARFVIDVGHRILVWVHGRSHLQTGVSFWQRAYVGSVAASGLVQFPQYRTGDRELSPFESLTLGPGVRYLLGLGGAFDDLALSVQSDFTYSTYRDALYLGDRSAVLAVLGLETGF